MNRIRGKDIEGGAKYSDTCGSLNQTAKAQNEVRMSRFRTIKNLFVVSFGFLCLFTSFHSLDSLQSSLNKEDGIGVAGLAIIYGALLVSCILFPSFIIAKLGCKWTIFVSMLCFSLYMAANFYAVWGTIVPSTIILGVAAAPLWSAKSTYVTEIATRYAKQTGANSDDIINRFFGVFFMLFKSGRIWGSLISSMVFQRTESTNITDENSLLTCGADFCPSSDVNNTNLDKPDYDKSFVACVLGIEDIGFVMICYGVVGAICSFSFGRLVQFVGHIPFFILAFLLHGGLQITFLLWKPNSEQVYLFYIFAALWAMGDAVLHTQVNALYGSLWTKQLSAAFSNYQLCEALGFITAFTCQNFLCTNVKIFICLGFLGVGTPLYGLVEITRRSDKHNKEIQELEKTPAE